MSGHERRQFGRRAVFKHAQYLGAVNSTPLACIVVDISAGGARIRMTSDNELGDSIYLLIPDDDFAVQCRVVHVNNGYAGLEFISSPRRLSWRKQNLNPAHRQVLHRAVEAQERAMR